MVEWAIVGKMWLGFGANILVLVILSLVAWAIGSLIQKSKKEPKA